MQNTITLVFRKIQTKVQDGRQCCNPKIGQILATCSIATKDLTGWISVLKIKCFDCHHFFFLDNQKTPDYQKKQQELDFLTENRADSDIPQTAMYYK